MRETDRGVVISVRVTPRSSRDEIRGVSGDALKVRLRAPPVEGKANAALVSFLSAKLGIPKKRVVVESGATGRNKRVLLAGVSPAAAQTLGEVGQEV